MGGFSFPQALPCFHYFVVWLLFPEPESDFIISRSIELIFPDHPIFWWVFHVEPIRVLFPIYRYIFSIESIPRKIRLHFSSEKVFLLPHTSHLLITLRQIFLSTEFSDPGVKRCLSYDPTIPYTKKIVSVSILLIEMLVQPIQHFLFHYIFPGQWNYLKWHIYRASNKIILEVNYFLPNYASNLTVLKELKALKCNILGKYGLFLSIGPEL